MCLDYGRYGLACECMVCGGVSGTLAGESARARVPVPPLLPRDAQSLPVPPHRHISSVGQDRPTLRTSLTASKRGQGRK